MSPGSGETLPLGDGSQNAMGWSSKTVHSREEFMESKCLGSCFWIRFFFEPQYDFFRKFPNRKLDDALLECFYTETVPSLLPCEKISGF